jgi:hypothetical protein
MTNFERKKKNGALDALRGDRARILAGIFAVIGSALSAVGKFPSSPGTAGLRPLPGLADSTDKWIPEA